MTQPVPPHGSSDPGARASSLPALAGLGTAGAGSSANLPAAPGEKALGASRAQWRNTLRRRERDVSSHIKDYLLILWRRKLLIASFALLVTAIMGVKTLRTPKLYRAQARLSVGVGGAALSGLDQTFNYFAFRGEIARHIESLKGSDLARKVIASLNLAEHPSFRGMVETPEAHRRRLERERSTIEFALREKFGTAAIEPEAPGETPNRRADRPMVGALRSMVDIEQDERNQNIITLVCTSAFPELASAIPNAMADEFRKMKADEASGENEQSQSFLREKLDAVERELEEAENQLRKNGDGDSGGLVALEQQIEEAKAAYTLFGEEALKVTQNLLQTEARYQQIKADPETALDVRQSAGVAELRKELRALTLERTEKAALYKPGYPELKELDERIASVGEQMDREIQATLAAIEVELEANRSHLAKLDAEKEKQRQFLEENRAAVGQYEVLRQIVKNKTELRGQLLEGLQRAALQQGVSPVEVHILDPAETPTSAFYPNTTRNLVLGLLAGLVVGAMFAMGVEFLDNTVKTSEEIEHLLGLPTLATIPALGKRANATTKRTVRRPVPASRAAASEDSLIGVDSGDGAKRAKGGKFELISFEEPRGAYAERFRFLRTAIAYSTPGGAPKVMAFTSCLPQEGKTTISINTAITFAKRDLRVVLVDCDLKKPKVHKHFGLERRVGLTTVLTNNADVDDVIQPSPVDGLDIITAGHLPPNPTDLIDSKQMVDLLEELRSRYDMVIFDSAPLFNIPDTSVLATHIDGLALVVHAGSTPRDLLKDTCEHLESLNARLIGVVLNKQEKGGGAGYGKYGSYKYRYNYDYGYGYSYGNFKAEEPERLKRRTAAAVADAGDDAS